MKYHYLILIALFVGSLCTEVNAQVMTYDKYNTVSYKGNTYKILYINQELAIHDNALEALNKAQRYVARCTATKIMSFVGLGITGIGLGLFIDHDPSKDVIEQFKKSVTVMGFGLLTSLVGWGLNRYSKSKAKHHTNIFVNEFNGGHSRLEGRHSPSYHHSFGVTENGLAIIVSF